MTSEYVFAQLYNKSAIVECIFNMENFGEDLEIEVGFPEMNFTYWSMSGYTPIDKQNFKIYVDGQLLDEDHIKVPEQMAPIYQKYMSAYKKAEGLPSELWMEFEQERAKGNFPWYVWKVKFKKQEKKQIKVVYELPSGLGYRGKYRYFNYILQTGSGWYKSIEKAVVELKLHDIPLKNIEQISPKNYKMNESKKTITWTFTNLEPTKADDIYL